MHDMSHLFNPKSIALFGGWWSENVITQLIKSGYEGKIWPVHPKRKEICGIACFKDVSELPAPPDASFIGVNRHLTIDIVKALSNMGAKGAICFASGFLESDGEDEGGAKLQDELVEAAGDMPILGPNCYGLLNYLDNITLWPDQHGGRAAQKGVAILGQSSNILINISMQKRSLPISHIVAAGNQAQTGLADMASHLLDDDRVTAIGLYIEGFCDIRALEEMSQKARKLGKAVVAIKIGKSEKSQMATLSHTASLAGGSAASSALLKRLGIVEVNSIAVFLETLKLLHAFGPLKGNAISSLSCSGGEAGLVADMAQGTAINFRDISNAQHVKLKQVLGSLVTVNNPLDYHTFIWGDEEKLTACYSAMFEDNFDLNILIMDIPPDDRCDPSAWDEALSALKTAKANTNANVAMLTTLNENLSESLGDELMTLGIVPLHGMEEMIEAVDACIKAGEIIGETHEPVLLAPLLSAETTVMNEANSKKMLAQYGVKFPNRITADSIDELAPLLENLNYPVALKGLGIAHKTEAGAVVLDLNTADEVKQTANAMKQVSGFLVEEMVPSPIAEVLIGVTRDASGMLLLSIGAGGIMTELIDDTCSLIIPAKREEIEQAIDTLKLSKILSGYRGRQAADMNKLLDAILAVQNFCLANTNLVELDINPLMVLEHDAIAVDALIKIGHELK